MKQHPSFQCLLFCFVFWLIVATKTHGVTFKALANLQDIGFIHLFETISNPPEDSTVYNVEKYKLKASSPQEWFDALDLHFTYIDLEPVDTPSHSKVLSLNQIVERFFNGAYHLILSNFIHCIDMIKPLNTIPVYRLASNVMTYLIEIQINSSKTSAYFL